MRITQTPLVLLAAGFLACGGGDAGDNASTSVPEPAAGVVNINGADLRWVREGTGPTIFVLGSAVYYPRAYSERLREHFELVFIDGRHFVPGYQPGEEALAGIDLGTFADDVELVRRELGYGDITVLGHSVHGQIALEYADKYPATTSRVVLVGPVPHNATTAASDQLWEQLASEHRKSVMEARLGTLDEALADVPPERRFAAAYIHRSPLAWADPEYDATEVFAGLETGPAFGRLVASVSSPTEAAERLRRIQAPILLVLGRLDFLVPYTAWEQLIDGVESIDYVLLPDDSHNPQTEFPDRFDPILIEWYEGH